MFDKIYVLSKGGKCVFEGKPQLLRQILLKNNIECNKTDVPIDVLLRISSEGKNNQKVIDLSEEQFENKVILKNRIKEQNMHSFDCNLIMSKRFSFKDFHYLLVRTMIISFISKWYINVFITLSFIINGITFIRIYNKKMIEPSGCIEWSLDSGCNKTVEELNDETLINEHLKYLLAITMTISTIYILIILNSFSTGIKIFENERHNGN